MTSYFEIQGCSKRKQENKQENKKSKHLRGSGETAEKMKTGKKWKANEKTGSSLHLRCTFISHLRYYDFCFCFCLKFCL